MFLVALVLVSALAVPLTGGRLGALVELPLRHVWAIYAALGLAVLGVGLPGLPDGLRSLLLVAAYPVGAVRAWSRAGEAGRDRRHPGAVPHGTARSPPPPQTDGGCTPGKAGEMELEATGTVLPELIACPEPGWPMVRVPRPLGTTG